ncbi:MAG: hypothetical protein LLG01_08540 [Planctomycetaceae bacterium]|nr:hypothetical protein [Planctomycetaceae bacterium]
MRYHPPSKWVLGPWYGTGFPDFGKSCGSYGKTHEDEIGYDLDNLTKHDIPITCYHCDGTAWARNDTLVLSDAMIQRLREKKVRLLLHLWGQDDLATWKRTHDRIGDVLGGYYLDEKFKARIGGDDETSLKAMDIVRKMLPRDGEVILKTYGPKTSTDAGLKKIGHVCYVNDLGVDWGGLRTGIRRVFSKSQFLPAPYNEFTAYDVDKNRRPVEEIYFRRLHWGAMQVVMDNSPWVDCDPWTWGYSPRLLEAYRYWSWLHLELAAYLHSYDYNAYETNEMIFRQPNAAAYTTKLGEEIFVAYVTDTMKELAIELPAGEWINYWDESQVLQGKVTYPVPLGKEPIFIRNGSMIPLDVSRAYTGHGTAESAGSLTVLVYPKGECLFKYRDDGLDVWVTFKAAAAGDKLTLTASRAPSQSVLYRIAHMAAPQSVSVEGLSVKINQGGNLARAASEKEVNGSKTSAWYYDSPAKRLIVKAMLK